MLDAPVRCSREPLAAHDDDDAHDPRGLVVVRAAVASARPHATPATRPGVARVVRRHRPVPATKETDMLIPDDDHRALAARLDLCHFEEDAPGMVYWHPRGWTLYRLLEDAARAHVLAAGYREVRAPQLLRRAVWERSGHWDAFHDAMFTVGDLAGEAALRPVSCPGHIQLVRRLPPPL